MNGFTGIESISSTLLFSAEKVNLVSDVCKGREDQLR